MAEVTDVLLYLLAKHVHGHRLSNARLTKLVYLADWKHAIERGRQITGIQWRFETYGPFVPDVMDVANASPQLFAVSHAPMGSKNQQSEIRLVATSCVPSLSDDERASLDHVIAKTTALAFDAVIRLVYSTYPVIRSERYTTLDLVALAREYLTLLRERGEANIYEIAYA